MVLFSYLLGSIFESEKKRVADRDERTFSSRLVIRQGKKAIKKGTEKIAQSGK
jgi:hypothetical protein